MAVRRRFAVAGFLALAVSFAACPGPQPPADGGVPDAGTGEDLDGGGQDAGVDGGADDAGFDAGPPDPARARCPPRDGGIPDGGRLRIVAANLSSGNLQTWEGGEGARILDGLNPDVTLMQEWNLASPSDDERRDWVNQVFGPEFCFHVESGAAIPNGVVSRWPILDAGQWADSQVTNRSFAWVQLDVPGPRNLWAVSVHLLTSNATQRNTEGQDLVAAINQVVPAGDLLVVGGDLNTGSRNESVLTTLGQVVRVSGPWPADGSGNTNTNASRSQPYDWVLADPDLGARQVPAVVVGAGTFDAGLVFDSRVFNPLSAVSPVLSTDSAAVNMQHMAVVRDFILP
jgi:endonuclease/exonuclease/phosphatase family metal-dependent hydrolase